MGWGWAGVIWLYSLVTYIPLDILKFGIRYAHSGKAWDTLLENKVWFTSLRPFSFNSLSRNSTSICRFKFSTIIDAFLCLLHYITLQTAFTTKKDYGKEEREAQWAAAQRTLHGLQPPENSNIFPDKSSYRELSEIAEQAKRRAEVARLVQFVLKSTLKLHLGSQVHFSTSSSTFSIFLKKFNVLSIIFCYAHRKFITISFSHLALV